MNKQEAIDSLECFRRNTAHILGDNDEKVKTIETCIMLVEEIEDVPDTNVGKWIPVSEKLPEYGIKCLADFVKGSAHRITISHCYMQKEGFWSDTPFQFEAIAWMPMIIPEAYKEDKNGTGSL